MKEIVPLIIEIFSESLAAFQTKAFIENLNSENLDDISSDEDFFQKKKQVQDDDRDIMIHRQLKIKKQRILEMRSKKLTP